MDSMMFFNDGSIEVKFLNQLKNEIVHREKLIDQDIDTRKLVLVKGESLCDCVIFAKILHDDLKEIGMENDNEFVVMDPVFVSDYENSVDMMRYMDNAQVNIVIDNNDKISTDWFDYIFNLKTPDSKCRKKFIENLLSDNEELIDDYDKVVDKFVRLTDGLNYSLIDTIAEHIKRYAVVNDKKIDVVMIVDCVVDIKENHGSSNYWS